MRLITQPTSLQSLRRGFTAAELTIGMVVAGLVASAGAAVVLAVSQGWNHAERTGMAQVRLTRTCNAIEQVMRDARLIGRYRAGTLSDPTATPAGILIWREDINTDNQVQFEEISVLEFDGPNRSLVQYKAEFATEAIRAAANTTLSSTTALSDPDAIEQFKASSYVVAVPLTQNGEVGGACFNVVAANNRGSLPSFEFTLQFTVGGQTTMHYGTATLRSPAE